jgi:hypothetical protein
MREQLIQYVNLLFAGVTDADEIKQEILQNTLDRYDDLMDQGKTPEAAYRLAISGIGDINEILSSATATDIPQAAPQPQQNNVIGKLESIGSKALKACAIALYILCPIPVIVMAMIGMETLGLCGTLGMVAIATVMLVLSRGDNGSKQETTKNNTEAPETELKKSVRSLIGAVGFAVYMIVSFTTGAWHITWLIFPILGAVRGLVFAIMDLKENN